MNKFLILLTCLVGLTAAGILNPLRILDIKDREQIGTDRILAMSQDELLRQKFLLDILIHVQQPLINEEVLRLGLELIIDPQRYLNGIDDEILNFFELVRNQVVLGQQDTYSITNEDHLRQMIGLYRLLVNSRDWDTFQRNTAFARTHINGVLLVNALILAVRDREDTRILILPAIQEILPELFYDEQLINKAQQLDINLLNIETRRPGLLDLIAIGRRRQLLQRSGLGTSDTLLDRTQLWLPWREMRVELATRRANGESINLFLRNEEKLVLPVERRLDVGGNRDMSLLTEDIGLNGFLYNLINNLVLNEQELFNDIDSIERIEDDKIDRKNQIGGRVGLERNEGTTLERNRLTLFGQRTDLDDGRTDDTDIVRDTDRILHIGRRRLLNRKDVDLDDDRTIIRENRILDGRRVIEDENLSLRGDKQNVLRRNEVDLPTTTIDNERSEKLNIDEDRRTLRRDQYLNKDEERRISGRNQNINNDEDRQTLGRSQNVGNDENRSILGRAEKLNIDEDRRTLRRDQYLNKVEERRIIGQDQNIDNDEDRRILGRAQNVDNDEERRISGRNRNINIDEDRRTLRRDQYLNKDEERRFSGRDQNINNDEDRQTLGRSQNVDNDEDRRILGRAEKLNIDEDRRTLKRDQYLNKDEEGRFSGRDQNINIDEDRQTLGRGQNVNNDDDRRILGRAEKLNIDDDRRTLKRDQYLNKERRILGRGQNIDNDEDRRVLDCAQNLNNDEDRRVGEQSNLLRSYQRSGLEGINDLPTRRIDDERLLRVNRRRLNKELLDNNDDEILKIRNDRRRLIGEGHRVRNRDDRKRLIDNQRYNLDDDQQKINVDDIELRKDDESRRTGVVEHSRDDERRRIVDDRAGISINQQQKNNINNIGFRTTTIDDDRLLHVNRRRLNQNIENQNLQGERENFLEIVRRGIREGRRILDREDERDLDISIRNNIDDERLSQINNRRRIGSTLDDRRRTDEALENQELERDIGLDRRVKIEQRRINVIDDNGLEQRIKNSRLENDDTIQRRRLDIDDQDRLLVTGRRRRVDSNDVDATERGTNTRRRVARSLRNDIMNTDRTIIQRLRGGELLLHNLQQLIARIDLERISLRLTDLDTDNIDVQGQRLNNPRLGDDTNTGERWALRLNDMRLNTRRNRILLQRINEIEQRLVDVIERTLQVTNSRDQQGIDRVIGDVLVGRVQDSVGILQILRELLQETINVQDENTISSGNLATLIRDPIVQQLLRRIVRIADRQRQQLGSYRREDIALDGVRINDIAIDRLLTYVDASDTDLINLLDQRITQQRDQLQQKILVARQQRLNHKSFNINIDLSADREQRVVIRTLLIPKVDAADRELRLDESRLNALLLDATVVNLRVGQNKIKRKSRDINWTTRDTTPLTLIYQRVLLAIDGKLNTVPNELIVGNTGRFPNRLLLPRGRVEGLPMQVLVVVTPVSDIDLELQQNIPDSNLLSGIGANTLQLDTLPLGFPLDRKIADVDQLLDLPNLLVRDVLIYHDDKVKLGFLQ